MDLKQYDKILKRLESQLSNESDWLANLSNTAQLLGLLIEDINWLGFYLHRREQLVLGPFWGNPAVTRIAFGSGVCGTVAQSRQALIVPDVHAFSGHIVCDIVSNSEIVIPIVQDNRLLGVLDIDSPSLNRFSEIDLNGLEALVRCLVCATDWNDFN